MNKLFQKYSIFLVTFMVILYSVFAELKIDSEPTFIYPFYGLYMVLILVPIILSFALEKYLPKYIEILKYTRFVTYIVMILLIVLIFFRINDHNNNIFSSTYILMDNLLGGILVVLLVSSSTLEDMYYNNEELNAKSFLKELGVKSLVFMSITTMFIVGISLVVVLGYLGVNAR